MFLRDGAPATGRCRLPAYGSRCGWARQPRSGGPRAMGRTRARGRPVRCQRRRGGLLAPLIARFGPRRIRRSTPGAVRGSRWTDREAGWVGELHPRWQQKYELRSPVVLFEVDAGPRRGSDPVPRGACRFPPVTRDLSVLSERFRCRMCWKTSRPIAGGGGGHSPVRSLPWPGRAEGEKKSCFPSVIARYSKNDNGSRGRRRGCAGRQRRTDSWDVPFLEEKTAKGARVCP